MTPSEELRPDPRQDEVGVTQAVEVERYIVVKRKHLTEVQEANFRRQLSEATIPIIECVVVESDWPEYEPVWSMIEARCSGKPSREQRMEEALREIEEGPGPAIVSEKGLPDYPISEAENCRRIARSAIRALSLQDKT